MRWLILALALAACGPESTPDEELDGGDIYLASCESCHGYDGRGTDTGADLYWAAEGMTVEEVSDVVVLGEGTMRAVDLDDSEAEAVAAFLLDVLVRR